MDFPRLDRPTTKTRSALIEKSRKNMGTPIFGYFGIYSGNIGSHMDFPGSDHVLAFAAAPGSLDYVNLSVVRP